MSATGDDAAKMRLATRQVAAYFSRMASPNLLLVADSEKDADMLYAVGMFVPDPFIYLRLRGRSIVVMSDLEIDRAKKAAPHCRVLALSKYAQQIHGKGARHAPLHEVVRLVLREHRVSAVAVPPNFPHGLACKLIAAGIRIKPTEGPCFPDREFKTADEIRKIKAAVAMAEVGMAEAIEAIRRSRVDKTGRLIHHNERLTSERVQAIIGSAIFQAGGVANNTIVAGGEHGCDPHERGHGPLKANQPIILDIFPRAVKTGYFGDITRTVVKGRASDAVRKMYGAVQRAQQAAIGKIRVGQPMAAAHQAVVDTFAEAGFKTGRRNGHMEGFFHGTGHGLGMEIHEAPRVSAASKDIFKTGQVVTVEPGLYYPGIGGVRLEDDLVVANGHPRNLTRFEKVLEVWTSA
ncbi:MAG: M24 family metallopeptidase [Pedosphaera sp.]|nr:M24 family metallopeptidase [Pedosphaera sp.]MSU43129.1 M24 family metallopeptidase [Pedosphaera sp.]